VPELPDIDELTKGLDPAATAVVKVVYAAFRQLEEHLGAHLEKLEAENAELKRLLFGQKRERSVMPSAKREAARRAKATETPEQQAARKQATQQKRKARKAARAELPVVEQRLELPTGELCCAHCGGAFRPLGEGLITEQIDYVP